MSCDATTINREILAISPPTDATRCTSESRSLGLHSRSRLHATGEDEIMKWNYDRANENNTTGVHMPHDVDAPSWLEMRGRSRLP